MNWSVWVARAACPVLRGSLLRRGANNGPAEHPFRASGGMQPKILVVVEMRVRGQYRRCAAAAEPDGQYQKEAAKSDERTVSAGSRVIKRGPARPRMRVALGPRQIQTWALKGATGA